MKRVNTLVGHLTTTSNESGLVKEDQKNLLKENETSGGSKSSTKLFSGASKVLYANRSGNTSKYRYTMDKYAEQLLTREQREFYDKNGYIVIRKLLNPEEIKYFYQRFDELVENPKLRPIEMLVMRDISLKDVSLSDRTDSNVVTKLQEWAREEGLWKYAKNEKIVSYIKAICGEDLRAMHFMVINKPPDSGALSSRHPFHQDQWYFPFGPCDHTVCSWTALQRIDRHNGCLSVIPGSHRNSPGGKLLIHDYPKQWHGPVNKAYHGVQIDDINPVLRQRVHLEMEAGDTVFFHPLLLHASGANLSHANRRSISVHYANSVLCEYVDVEELGQQKIAAEVQEIRSKRRGYGSEPITFQEIWASKSRQVCGNEGNLKSKSKSKQS